MRGSSLIAVVALIGTSVVAAQTPAAQPGRRLFTFKEATDIVAATGAAKNLPQAFCLRYELSCDAQGWPVKLKGARNNKMQRTVAIGLWPVRQRSFCFDRISTLQPESCT